MLPSSRPWLFLPVMLGLSLGVARAAAPALLTPTEYGALGTYVRGADVLMPGSPAAVRVAAHWATSEEACVPLSRVQVQVRMAGPGRSAELFRGQTDDTGAADARFQVPLWPPGEYTLFVDTQIGPHKDHHSQKVKLAGGGRLLLQSDKPLYQPSQIMHLRGMALRDQGGVPLSKGQVRFEVHDPRKNLILSTQRRVSDHGIVAVDLPLADELVLGSYTVRAVWVNESVPSGAKPPDDQSVAPAELKLMVSRFAPPRFKLSMEPDQRYYAPGTAVRLALKGSYPKEQPLAGASVDIHASVIDGRESNHGSRFAILHAQLDKKGEANLTFTLPAKLEHKEGWLQLDATAVDGAGHREPARMKAPLSKLPVRVDFIAEAGWLIPEFQNRIWGIATYPDGTPATGIEMELLFETDLTAADAEPPRRRTDAMGVATFLVKPSANTGGRRGETLRCASSQRAMNVQVNDRSGLVAIQERCMDIAQKGGLLLRTDRAIYPQGMPLELSVESLGGDGVAYVDILRDEQIVSTTAVPLRKGVGRATLPPDPRRAGTLTLEAYRVAPDGEKFRDSRTIYVERPDALQVELRPETGPDGSIRPATPGRIQVRVRDAVSGAGVSAAVGITMVDEALLALHPLQEGRTRTFFNLLAQAQEAGRLLRARPGGHTIEELLIGRDARQDLDGLRQEAAQILLAGALPPWKGTWETDPWAERREAWEPQLERLGDAFLKYRRTHLVGERVPGAKAEWRFRHDLAQAMAADGAIARRDVRDPWGQPIAAERITESVRESDFDSYARVELSERMTEIYRGLSAEKAAGRLAPDLSSEGRRRTVRITPQDLAQLVERRKLPMGRLFDPWRKRFRLLEKKQPFAVSGIWSRFFLISDGPDGVSGTPDDLVAHDGFCSAQRFHPSIRSPVVGVPLSKIFSPEKPEGPCVGGVGYGRGAGGLGGRRASAPEVIPGTAELLYWPPEPEPVRSVFPETLLWHPQVFTDSRGEAVLQLDLPDAHKTWRLSAEALAQDGRMGEAVLPVQVARELLVDLDLPAVWTQEDELSIPVTVQNVTKSPQRVRIELTPPSGFERLAETTQHIDLVPAQRAVRSFRLRAQEVGLHKLLVRVSTEGPDPKRDTMERSVDVRPKGAASARTLQDRLRAGAPIRHHLEVPANAIPGAGSASLKLYPAAATHVEEGLDALQQQPSGGFEQTASILHSGALLLQHYRRTGPRSPSLEQKAEAALQAGYQRLLAFEVQGGGFSTFPGKAPANQLLTAYGLEALHALKEVHPVEPKLLGRTTRWLLSKQRPDGSFAPDRDAWYEGISDRLASDPACMTAYIAATLRRIRADPAPILKATEYVQRTIARQARPDPFALALYAELFGGDFHERLWGLRTEARIEKEPAVSFVPTSETLLQAAGQAAIVETTAMAASLFLRAPEKRMYAEQALKYLRQNLDSTGIFYATPATARAQEVLLQAAEMGHKLPRGTLMIKVDQQPVRSLLLDGRDRSLRRLDLPQLALPGGHDIELLFSGSGPFDYQLVWAYHQPISPQEPQRKKPEPVVGFPALSPAPRSPDTEISYVLDASQLAVGEILYEQVRIRTRVRLNMPIVSAGIPPGFDLDNEQLETLLQSRVIEKFQRRPHEVLFYLRSLTSAKPVLLPLRLKARLPGRVLVPPPTLHQTYQPEHLITGLPIAVTVLPQP